MANLLHMHLICCTLCSAKHQLCTFVRVEFEWDSAPSLAVHRLENYDKALGLIRVSIMRLILFLARVRAA
eukprot:scaffold196579_cov31-Tisochrysis_lutea.AAC.1